MTSVEPVAGTTFKPFVWFVRAALTIGLLVGLVFDLEQLEGKGWEARAVFYALVMFVLPVVWRLTRRRFTYSYLADAFLVMPFALDIYGNLFGLFDSMKSFDDILHFANWFFLTGAFLISVARSSRLSRLNLAALGTGFGATMIILWEAVEYVVMKAGTERLNLTYEDTIGDLLLSTAGGFVMALVVAFTSKHPGAH